MDPPVNRAGQDVWIRAEEPSAVGAVRRVAVGLAQDAGFDTERVGQVAVAVTEAASNLVKHAVEGMALVRPCPGAPEVVELITLDHGPGMPDVARAMRDGYSTSGTLGIGLGAITRIASSYDVHSLPGKGTLLAVHFGAARSGPIYSTPVPPAPVEPGGHSGSGRPGAAHPGPAGSGSRDSGPAHSGSVHERGEGGAHSGAGRVGKEWEGPPRATGLVRAIGEETVSGDAFALAIGEEATTVLICDGLGHGPAAACASQTAVELFRSGPDDEPLAILRRLHAGLSPTRGGAAAVARVTREKVTYAAVGNISGWIVHPDRRQGMVSVPGIAGHQARRLQQFEYELDEYATVVLHSDGLSGRWSPAAMPGLFSRSPAVVAAGLLREAGTRRDDACVVVVRPRR